MINEQILLPGTAILHTNAWTGFEMLAMEEQFRPVTAADIRVLREGDPLYLSSIPLHPQGHVCGRLKVNVVAVESLPSGEVRIRYSGGSWNGFRTTKGGECAGLDLAKDEKILVALIDRFPLATKLQVFGSR